MRGSGRPSLNGEICEHLYVKTLSGGHALPRTVLNRRVNFDKEQMMLDVILKRFEEPDETRSFGGTEN